MPYLLTCQAAPGGAWGLSGCPLRSTRIEAAGAAGCVLDGGHRLVVHRLRAGISYKDKVHKRLEQGAVLV